jgi:hypothetical protein
MIDYIHKNQNKKSFKTTIHFIPKSVFQILFASIILFVSDFLSENLNAQDNPTENIYSIDLNSDVSITHLSDSKLDSIKKAKIVAEMQSKSDQNSDVKARHRVSENTEVVMITDPKKLSQDIWTLYQQMNDCLVRISNDRFSQVVNNSLVDFNRLCPNYPHHHFTKMNQAELGKWVNTYPNQAKALKEILEYVNSELKK